MGEGVSAKYRRQVCEHACEKVELAFARAFIEWNAGIYICSLHERIDEQGQRVDVYLIASWVRDWGRTAACTRLCWVEWPGRGGCSNDRNLKGQEGGTGPRRRGEIGKKHRGEITKGCLRVLRAVGIRRGVKSRERD
jgi:hypothetical protein